MESVKAHLGEIVALRTRKYEESIEKGNFIGQLISYASDNMVLVWMVKSKEIADTTGFGYTNKLELNLELILQVDMIDRPYDLLLVQNSLVLITECFLCLYR